MTEISNFKNREEDQLKRIGNNLRNLRNKRGHSQSRIAEEIGCHQDRISRIENGTARISVYELVTLSKFYNITPNEILDFPPNNLKPDEFELFIKIKRLHPQLRDNLNNLLDEFLKGK